MIDNFEEIKSMLIFESDDDFYHLQILKRKKEHPDLGANSHVLKTYYISSLAYLDLKKAEIINMCDFNNARACINLNRRSFEKIAFHVMRKVADQLMNRDFRSVRKAYESCCGANSNEPNKKWIVDIDTLEEDDLKIVKEVRNLVYSLQDELDRPSFSKLLKTRNGYHLIASPFRLDKFKKNFPNIEVHKDNPTILYVPTN